LKISAETSAHLREFAAEGDPFSQAVLAGLPLPGA
jgi:hypothetical protein